MSKPINPGVLRLNTCVCGETRCSHEKIAIKKYGKGGTSSGQILGDILGKAFGSKKKKKDKK